MNPIKSYIRPKPEIVVPVFVFHYSGLTLGHDPSIFHGVCFRVLSNRTAIFCDLGIDTMTRGIIWGLYRVYVGILCRGNIGILVVFRDYMRGYVGRSSKDKGRENGNNLGILAPCHLTAG